MLASNSELGALSDILIFGCGGLLVVNPDVEQVYSSVILAVIAAHVRSWPMGLHHDRDAMELGVSWMKDVSRHA
jgi:hypothetical protein